MNKVVIVVGMHRSGTSLLSLFLSEMGVCMGDDMLPSSNTNPTGHHEDLFFLKKHSEILNKLDSDWDSPPEKSKLSNEWHKHIDAISDEINSRKNNKKVWGWKDPRTSLFLDNYIKLLGNPLIIYCKRTSSEVEDSIYARDKINKEHSRLLKKHYDSEVKKSLENYPESHVLEIDFKEIIKEPRKTLENLELFLDVRLKDEDKNILLKKIIDRKGLKKVKSKKKTTDRYKLLLKALNKPIMAMEVLKLRNNRKKWRKFWYIENA